MADIFDYLEWRADVPFSFDPFNEADNLVLSELAYTDFRGCFPEGCRELLLPEVRERFFELNSREEIRRETWYTAPAPFLMDDMSFGARFRNTVMADFIDEIDEDRYAQISAMTFRLADGTMYVAFRGTDRSIVGWREDFNLSYMTETEGQRRAAEYLNAAGSRFPGKIRVGGHSKGGNFAVYAAAFCDRNVQDRIIEVWSNDGPGFRDEVINTDCYRRILPRIRSIVPESSMIGMLLTSGYSHHAVKSDAFGMAQHNGFSWQIKRNRFEETSLSELAVFVEETMADWLGKMDDDTRRSFAVTVFSLLESTGKDTFEELNDQKFRSAEKVISSLIELPKEKQTELIRLAGELIQSGGHAALARIPLIRENAGAFLGSKVREILPSSSARSRNEEQEGRI